MLLLGLSSISIIMTRAVMVTRAIAIIGQCWAHHHLGWSVLLLCDQRWWWFLEKVCWGVAAVGLKDRSCGRKLVTL